MRAYVGAAVALIAVAACQPSSEKTNPAIATPAAKAERTDAAPAAGANSFTMEQARDRIQAAGYSDVTALAQDAQGVWRGKAMKNAVSTSVMVDYQGNVTTQP